jgi:outer membrane protein insertion porin family
MDVRVSGTMKNPEYQGTIQLSNASLRIPDSPLILENLDLSASLEKKRLRLDKLEARSGGGVITGGGELVRGGIGSRVWVRGKNVAANYPEGLRSQMDFDLNLSASESDYLLSGDLRILRSLYEQELTFRNPIVRKLLATSKELTEEKQFKNRLKLALNVQTVQDLRFRNNSAILRIGGDLQIGGSLYKPRLTGGLSIREGSRIFLAGNQYDVEKASLEFYGSEFVEPNLDVTLSSLLRDFENDTYYEVFLPFGGTLSNLEFKNVRATPSLSQDQVFSLITDGTIESEQIGSSSERFQRQLLSFFAGQALGVPSAKIAKSIGLSRIKVQQEGLSSVNDPKTRLMLGKDIGAGFSLIYSFVLNDPQDQTWIATYRYGRNIIGRFIDQDDGTYTVSVSHRIPFGKGVRQSSISVDSRKKERGLRITSIELKNGSPLTENQIYKALKIDVGDYYDYWDFQDRAERLKKELQKMEYLYPIVDVREKEVEKGIVSLEIQVQSGDRSRMIFKGHKVDEKLLNHYKKMWRSGISAVVVQQMIREDLLRQLQLNGYYRVSVDSWIEKTARENIYYFQIDPREQFKSVEIEFRGSRNYDPNLLQKDLEDFYSSPAELFREAIHKPSKFSEKIKMLYAQKGYLRTVVEADHIQYQSDIKKIISVVQVTEGLISRIDSLIVSGSETFPESLWTKLQLKEGETFHSEALLDDELKIREFYESKGNQDVSIGYNIEFTAGASDLVLQWKLNSGPVARIASIRIEGNESTRTDLILKQIKLREGDVLTEQNRSVAKKRLSDLGIFQQTSLEIEETEKPGWYDVVVYVVENKKYEFQYGGRYNTDDKAGAEIRLSDFNFLGRAQNLSLYTRSTLDLPLFRVDYTMPVTGSFWDRMRLSIFRDETDEDVRATISGDLIKIPFTHKQLTAQFQQDHRFWNSFRVLWGFEFGSVTADFQDLVNGNPLQFLGTKAVFRGTLLSDRRDDPLNTKEGYFYSVDGEFAPTVFGSDISYLKNFSQFFYYKKLGKIVSATGIRAGFLKLRSNILTVGEKFRTGGSTTLRGFEHNTVVPGNDPISIFFGGNSVFILNEEIRLPIYKWFTGAVFYDAGNTYFRVSDFDPTDLRHSAGFGFRAGGGGFVLRIDVGFNLDPEDDESQTVFHFGIGQAF